MAVSIEKKGKINVVRMVLGALRTNSYLIYDEEGRGILVDPADDADIIKIKLKDLSVKLETILLTHGHFDHIGAADEIRESTNALIYAFSDEKEVLENSQYNLSAPFAGKGFTLKADKFLCDNEKTNLSGFDITVIHTPGHTKGSCCYLVTKDDETILISGDTLFAGSHGRYDFPTGSYSQIIHSIKDRLLTLDENLSVYPGHNEVTTIGAEKIYY